MTNYEEFIVSRPDVCNGQPVIKGTRIRLKVVLDSLAEGHAPDEIVRAYPGLTREAVCAAIAFHQESIGQYPKTLLSELAEFAIAGDDLPHDLAEHHDHYLYGTPKHQGIGSPVRVDNGLSLP